MDKKLYDKRKKPDCKKEQQRKEIFSTYSELCPQKPQDNRLSGLETGNKKTGKSGRIYDKILVWNIPPRITCPGVSDWCSTHCYNADARKDVYTIDRWCENLWDFHFRLPELKDKIENQINETTGRCAVRLHSSGDFFSEEYIDFWKEIILEFPKVSFWGYTRTWNVPCLKDNVNELMNLNNMQLFASYDTTMATSVPAIPKSLVFDTRENLFEYAEQQYRMWFRGQSDYSWGLVPSVQRKDGMGKNYEQYISTNFMIHTMRLNPNAPQRYDRASWLTLMQHYGLPTRLLDWSESPLVALYFALSSDEDAKTDAAVWVLNPMRLNKKVGYGEYVPPISYDSLRGDLEGAFSNHDNDDYGLQNRIIACHGVGCDLRMYVQQSDFTIHSTAERLDQILKLDESCDYFYKIRIPQQIRKQLLAQLDAMGFHESSIYPDMEHIAKEQADSHFNF